MRMHVRVVGVSLVYVWLVWGLCHVYILRRSNVIGITSYQSLLVTSTTFDLHKI